jgi:SAM-dependent methyltransferase
MKKNSVYKIWVIDDLIEDLEKNLFKCNYFKSGNDNFDLTFCNQPEKFLEQLTFEEVKPDAVLLDINFEHLNDENLHQYPDVIDKNKLGLFLLKEIKGIDPALPVLMMTSIIDSKEIFESGYAAADDFIDYQSIENAFSSSTNRLNELGQRIKNACTSCKNDPLYDLDQLYLSDKIAENYDIYEQSKISSVAYCHYENELIVKLLYEKMDETNSSTKIRILDIGCGTGRIEELIISDDKLKGNVEIVALDFSGKMLKILQNKILKKQINDEYNSIKIIRSPVETFDRYHHQYDDYFDVIIMGFGVLSHVNFQKVLPQYKESKSSYDGLLRLLRSSGSLFVSSYNENSIIYETIANKYIDDDNLSISGVLNLYTGMLKKNETAVACEGFNINRLVRFLSQAGVIVNEVDFKTFPTTHLALDNSEIIKGSSSLGFSPGSSSYFPYGYFSKDFYQMDKEISSIIKDKGHFIVGISTKPIIVKP